ncbi:MAG: PAS domain S-box protein [Chitinophagales bacterium]
MKKAFKNITNNRLIVLIYSILFLLLAIGGIKSIYKYVFISQTALSISIGAIIIILILLVTFLLRNVKKISRYNQLLIENDKMLFESKLLYKELFDKSPLAKWVCDRKTLKIYEVNEKAIQQYGYSKKEFLSLSVFDLLDKGDHERARKFIQSNDFGESTRIIRKHVKKNGDTFLVEIILNEIIYKGNKQILVAINDITEKLMAEQMIRRSEELYRSLFNNSPVFIWVCDMPTLKFLDVNETALQHFGYSKEEFLSMTAFDLLTEEDAKKVKERLKQPSESFFGSDRHVKKNGTIINVEIRVHIINYNGKKAGLIIGVDVTEKLKAEEDLIKSETRFRSLVENSHDGISLLDANGKLIYFTSSVQRILGYSYEELIGTDPGELIHPDDSALRSSLIQQLLTCFGETRHAEYRIKNKNGEWKWLRSNFTNMLHEPGIKAIVINYEDITERRLAEEKLKQEEEFYRAIMENSSDIQFVTNQKREITYASPSVYKNFEFEEKEILGKTSNDFWHPDDINATKEKIRELTNTPGKTIQIEVRVLDKNKNYRWCEARVSNQLQNPAIKGYVSNYTEITERKLAEEEIKNSEELYRSLFNKSPLPIFVADKKNLGYLEVSDLAVELYGYSREDFLKMTVFDIRPEEDHKFLQGIIDDGKLTFFRNDRVRHIKMNGETMIVDVALDTIHFKGEEAYLIIVNDITKNLDLQQQLSAQRLNEQIAITKATICGQEKERNELGKELHDNVNQILASAKIYLEAGMAKENKQMHLIEKGKDLVNLSMQEIRKISKSLMPPSLGKFTLREALRDLVSTIKLTKKNIQLKTKDLDEGKLDKDLKVSVYRIVQEQLNNILKYADASEIYICLNQTATELELKIADNGKGFDTTQKRNGIGITNMINRAAIFDGNVVIDSFPGNGCRVNAIFKLNEQDKNLRFPFFKDAGNKLIKPISS